MSGLSHTTVRDEADLQARVGLLATRGYGLLHYHTHDSRRSESGFPDSVFVGRKVLFRELKLNRRSRISESQKVWIARLADTGADAQIWYAEDYYSGAVDEQLRAAALRPTPGRGRADPPMAVRLAKRLYLKAGADNVDKAILLWDAGVAGVEHGTWIARAQELLALVADELPAGYDECGLWARDNARAFRHMPGGLGVEAVMNAIKADLAETAASPAAPSERARPVAPRRNGSHS